MTISQFTESIHFEKQKQYTIVDFSYNGLPDSSFDPIIKLLDLKCFNNLKVLNISFNRFTSNVFEILLDFLNNKQQLTYVNIVGNQSLASIESQKYFANIIHSGKLSILSKIIFVYDHWLDSKDWIYCLGQDPPHSVIDDVLINHKKYYTEFPVLRNYFN